MPYQPELPFGLPERRKPKPPLAPPPPPPSPPWWKRIFSVIAVLWSGTVRSVEWLLAHAKDIKEVIWLASGLAVLVLVVLGVSVWQFEIGGYRIKVEPNKIEKPPKPQARREPEAPKPEPQVLGEWIIEQKPGE